MHRAKWLCGLICIMASVGIVAACTAVNERAQPIDPGTLQATDETVLVQLGRAYAHSFPEGFYQEYALNDLGDQPVTISLTPTDNSDLALALFRAGDRADAVLRVNEGDGGAAETARFTPEAGLNYVLNVYEVAGKTGRYELVVK